MRPGDLLARLERAGVHYSASHHKRLRTVEEAKSVRPQTDYGHTKNLFVRNKKGAMWLLTLSATFHCAFIMTTSIRRLLYDYFYMITSPEDAASSPPDYTVGFDSLIGRK